jgi:P27 family predicted phage terminase small subunit
LAKTAQSAELLELKGRKPDASRSAGPSSFQGGRPTMPRHLTGAAKSEWRRMVRELVKRGTATKLDATILELHAVTYASWLECLAEIGDKHFVDSPVQDSSGQVYFKRVVNPAVAVAQQYAATLKQTIAALGASPASRKVSQMTKEGRATNETPKPGTAAALLAAAEGD